MEAAEGGNEMKALTGGWAPSWFGRCWIGSLSSWLGLHFTARDTVDNLAWPMQSYLQHHPSMSN